MSTIQIDIGWTSSRYLTDLPCAHEYPTRCPSAPGDQALALLGGYQVFRRVSRKRGTRLLLIVALSVSSIFPIALSLTDQLILVAVLATVAGFFVAGVDLILFDELMRAVPRQYGVTFTSIDTTLVNLATIIAPLIGAALVGLVSIEFALRIGAVISFVGVVLFARHARADPSASGPGNPASPKTEIA